MKARVGRGSLFVTIAGTATIVATLATPGTADTTAPAEESGTEVMDTLDEEDYMSAYGVATPEEARLQWEATDAAGELQVVLKKEEADVFGGLWVEHDPSFAIVVGVLAGHEKEVQAYIDTLGVTSVVRTQEVPRTLADLQSDLETAKAAAPFGVDFGSGIDQREGRVKILVENASDLESFAGAALADSVVVEISGAEVPAADIYGGLSLSPECTSGFSVEETNGTREGVTTAGHCVNGMSYAGTGLPWVDGMHSGSVDAQWHTTPGFNDPNKIQVTSSGTTRNVTSRKPLGQMVQGEAVCKYGRTTLYDCGDIAIVPYEPSDACVPVSNETFVLVTPNPNAGDMAETGDSGGPVFHDNPAKAYGQMVCASGAENMIFMPQNFLPDIGVRVDIT